MIDLKCIVELVKAVFLSLCMCFYLCLGKKKKKMDLCKYIVRLLGVVHFLPQKGGLVCGFVSCFPRRNVRLRSGRVKACFPAQPSWVLPGLCAGLGAGSSCGHVLICCCGGLCQPLCATSAAILLM